LQLSSPWKTLSVAHEPERLYEHVEKEGQRRLTRPRLELAATALVAGFDVVFGIAAMAIAHALAAEHFGESVAQLIGSLAFGIGFVFIVAGRSELFTENFFVPIAGLDRHDRGSWLRLGELWAISPVLNIAGGALLILVLSSQGVLPHGAGSVLTSLALDLDERSWTTKLLSAVAAGAIITLMTWIVEGLAEEIGVKLAVAWIFGAFLSLGMFNHVIVVTLELLFGIRYGADIDLSSVAGNFGLAAFGNLVGGVLFVTITRSGQARAGSGEAT
jgi:formate/nitrite transporter FocA (FNT family)